MVQSFSAATPHNPSGQPQTNNSLLSANDWAEQTAAEMPGSNQLSYLLGAISGFSNCHTVLFNSVGEVLGSIGPAPLQLLCNFLLENPGKTDGTVGAWRLHIHEHKTVNLSYVLVFAAKTPPQLSADFLSSAELLLSAVLGMASHADSLVADEGRQLLQLLEQGISAGQETRYWLRLAEFGFTRESGLRLLTLEPPAEQITALNPRDIRKLLLRCANGNGADATAKQYPLIVGVAMPAGKSTATVHALTVDNSDVISQLLTALPGVVCGISAGHISLTHLPFAVTEAETALEIAKERSAALVDPPSHAIINYGELELVEWLRTQVSRHTYLARVADFTAELRAHPEHLQTVIAYLANDLHINHTAQTLHIHPNTVRYRLDRAAEYLGADTLLSPFVLAGLITSFAPEINALRNTQPPLSA